MDIGKMINERRVELGLTLEEVGNFVGVSKSTVKKWEDGFISNMKRDKIALLAKVLKMNPVSFITGEKEVESIANIDAKNDTKDIDIRRIERARKNMPNSEKERMMKLLELSFEKYFSDNFVDDDVDE